MPPLLGPPPSRTATFSGTSLSGLPAGQPYNNLDFHTVSCPGGTAAISCTALTVDFEEDTSYVSTPPWPGAGSSRKFRARIVGGSTRSASSPAGNLSSTSHSQTTVGPWLIYNWPNLPSIDTSMYPNFGNIGDSLTASGQADFSGSLTLEHLWTTGPVTLAEKITAASLSVAFSATSAATLYYFDDTGTQQSLAWSYSQTFSFSASSSPGTTLTNYNCSVSGVTYSTRTWALSWSLPGCSYAAPGVTLHDTHNRNGTTVSSSNGPGTSDLTGTPFAGILTNHRSGSIALDEWSAVGMSWGPDVSYGATAQLRRYRDGAGIAGASLKWTSFGSDPGMTINTDSSGMATGYVWPYDGSTLLRWSATLNGLPTGGINSTNPADPSFPAPKSMLIDPTWADTNGYFLKAGSLGNFAALLPSRAYRRFHIGTLQLDDSHAFDFFNSLTNWNGSTGTGSGTLSLDLSALKLAPSSYPWRVLSLDTVKSLKCAFYRYYTVRVRSDIAGAQLKFGVGHRSGSAGAGFTYYYWTITISAANTWEDHVIDLALPESDSAGTLPMNYLKHPSGWFDNPWGAFDITAQTSGANYWVQSFTGSLNQSGNRIPSLLAGGLNAGYPNMFYQHSGSTTSDGPLLANGLVVERDYASASDYSRTGSVPGLPVFGRMLVNGVIAADIRPIINGAYSMTGGVSGATSCRTFWSSFATYWDDTANDTGLHIVPTNDPLGLLDALELTFERTGALWHRLNDTPGSPVTLDVWAEPYGGAVTAFPGAGDYYAGSYGTRIAMQFHHYLEGEMAGCLAKGGKPLAGKAVRFYRVTDTGTVIGSATSNDDGLWRWYAPYGVVQPYSNHPSGNGTSANPDWQKEFTNSFGGPPTAWNSTALARRFQPYIAQGYNFLARDASNFALKPGTATRQLFYAFDRWLTYFGFGDEVGNEIGLDLARNPWNWLYRSYVKASTSAVTVGRLAFGQAWQDVQVATDQDGEAVPTLLVSRTGAVCALYHNAAGHGRFWWSKDLGTTWEDRATWSSVGKYPRAAILPNDTLLLISYVGTGLTLHQSTDWQTASPPTLTSVATISSVPEQLAGLKVDRNGIVHRVHTDGTNLLHAYLDENGAWITATLATGDHPAYALGVERGIYARWNGSMLALEATEETYSATGTLPAFDLSALPAFATQYLGLEWDAGETALIGGIDPGTGDPAVYYLANRHTATAL
jgi:hypothetical protein